MKTLRLLLGILLSVLPVFAEGPLRFVQVTDTHFGQRDHFERMEQMVDLVHALPMDISFVVVTGDIVHDCITDSETVERVLQTTAKLNVPVHFVAGNHDILERDVAPTLAVYTNRFGPLVSAKDYAGVRCVFVCTEPLARGAQIPGYDPLAELEPLLDAEEVLVFHHIPAADNFYSNRMHFGWGRTDAGQRWSALLNRCDVEAVFAGHFHRDELHWLGDVPVYVCPPLSGSWGRQGAFRIVEYLDGRISFRTQYLK